MKEWETRLTELLNIRYPIIQGGLAHLAYADLAAAVCRAGGLGQLTAMTCQSPEKLREEIKRLRSLTDHPFGVNFAIGQHGRPFQDFLNVAVEEEVPVVTITGGNPTPVFDALKGTAIKKLVLVSSRRQAIKAEALGADAVIAVGFEGGGHLGRDDVGGLVLIPQVVDAINIPVVASGGIGDGRGLLAALALGAEGIEMGTRFIATVECRHAHHAYKQRLLEANEMDTVVIKKTLGAPARALRNAWTDQIISIEEQGGSYEDLQFYISGEANRRFIHEGVFNEGFGWAGQVVGRIHDIPTVNELLGRIITEAENIQARLSVSLRGRHQ
ncbi:NAD(P)H-dependent flavin oxidoreductase [Camelliibacillus cellulosilyticus]|uniref:Probable nitronate monooxygenase n=1 Tax=Camelliibacillus cellulosilyticus TaxID=2174486 RepID=A0ABV9GFW5_9BACL